MNPAVATMQAVTPHSIALRTPGCHRIEQRLDRDVHVGAVDGRAADEAERDHHDDRGRLRPLQRLVHDVTHEHAERDDERDDHERGPGQHDAGEVQPFHRLLILQLGVAQRGIPLEDRARRPARAGPDDATVRSSLRCA
jgi:hypothetical protein